MKFKIDLKLPIEKMKEMLSKVKSGEISKDEAKKQSKDILGDWKSKQSRHNKKNVVKQKKRAAEVSTEMTTDQIQRIADFKSRLKAQGWGSRMRKKRREGKLPQEHIDAMNALGFMWNPKDDEWEKMFGSFKNMGYVAFVEDWVNDQRKTKEDGTITQENLVRLNAISFPWEAPANEVFGQTNWDQHQQDELDYENNKTEEDKAQDLEYENKMEERNKMSADDIINEKGDNPINRYYSLMGVVQSTRFTPEERVKAAEESVKIFPKLFKGGRYNDLKSVPAIARLITYYDKERNKDKLLEVKKIIGEYQVLEVIYEDRINKVLYKYFKL